MSGRLPSEFAELEPFVEDWALATETERYSKRCSSPFEEIQRFYDAMFPRLTEALDYLDALPLDDLPEDALALLRLVYSHVCVSIGVEAWGQGRIPDTGASEILCVVEPIP